MTSGGGRQKDGGNNIKTRDFLPPIFLPFCPLVFDKHRSVKETRNLTAKNAKSAEKNPLDSITIGLFLSMRSLCSLRLNSALEWFDTVGNRITFGHVFEEAGLHSAARRASFEAPLTDSLQSWDLLQGLSVRN